MRLRDFLSAEDVRQTHLEIFRSSSRDAYIRQDLEGVESSREVEQRIRNVKARRVQRIIDSVDDFGKDRYRASWAHYMALTAGTHIWPDANHRTGMATFMLATTRAFEVQLSLPESIAEELVRRSKRLRDQFYLENRCAYYSCPDLADPSHNYRRLFSSYTGYLIVNRIAPKVQPAEMVE